MYHSLTIGDKNTYDDWNLVPNEFPRFTPPYFTRQHSLFA